jgi:hypothetical protein
VHGQLSGQVVTGKKQTKVAHIGPVRLQLIATVTQLEAIKLPNSVKNDLRRRRVTSATFTLTASNASATTRASLEVRNLTEL